MARHRPVGGLGRAFADHDLRTDELLAASPRSAPGHPRRPPDPQARCQLAAQPATALDVERLIDRLVRDPLRIIIREVHRESVGDLLRTPGGGSTAVLPDPPLRARGLAASRPPPARPPAARDVGEGTGRVLAREPGRPVDPLAAGALAVRDEQADVAVGDLDVIELPDVRVGPRRWFEGRTVPTLK